MAPQRMEEALIVQIPFCIRIRITHLQSPSTSLFTSLSPHPALSPVTLTTTTNDVDPSQGRFFRVHMCGAHMWDGWLSSCACAQTWKWPHRLPLPLAEQIQMSAKGNVTSVGPILARCRDLVSQADLLTDTSFLRWGYVTGRATAVCLMMMCGINNKYNMLESSH